MPATDLEILLGKYLAVLAVYTVALLFSTTHVLVLMFLGNPDWGLLLTTYFGYWIAGAALLSAGMLASCLTRSMTVAFVLGVVVIKKRIWHSSKRVGMGSQFAVRAACLAITLVCVTSWFAYAALRGEDYNALADYIIVHRVDGSSDEYYVRHPEEDEVYIAKLDIDLSTKFTDWIETDLLDEFLIFDPHCVWEK